MQQPDNHGIEAENHEVTDHNAAFSQLEDFDAMERGEAPQTEAPNEQGEALQISEADAAAAAMMLDYGLGLSEGAISMMAGVSFHYDEAQKAKFIEAAQPIIQKYGGTWLGWVEKYKDEGMLLLAAGGLTMTSVATIKRLKFEQLVALEAVKEKAAANDETVTQGGEHGEESAAA
ncbi:hypothetical protein GT360_07265 [Vibrio astriarenae]|uniref:Uncharacterized protein n=1 Tax=Vibrio astriarenae TaxID=1481923 RepID=A0A7Z2T2U6_9VIBR|nr:hypothetical protein [Vibrio astriarenae]QIA63329.1 hypothetical protein GT360_07265 [Vibrio astriarenae]